MKLFVQKLFKIAKERVGKESRQKKANKAQKIPDGLSEDSWKRNKETKKQKRKQRIKEQVVRSGGGGGE